MYKTRGKNIAILSGYVRYRPRNHSFYLMINSRILSKHIISLETKLKGEINQSKNLFILNLSKQGNTLQTRDKEITVSFRGDKILNDKQIKFLKDKNTKLSFPVKVAINPRQFNIDKYYLYPDKDSAKLAFNLEKLKINIPSMIVTSHSFKHDLEFSYKSKKVIIEITSQDFSEIYQYNFKHQRVGGNIRAHIFDIYRDCVTDKILNLNKKIGFVVLNNCWKNVKHIKEIIDECKLVKCYILFANFSNKNWARDIAKEIVKILKNDSRTNLQRNFGK